MVILDGKKTASILNLKLEEKIKQMTVKPRLEIILIGDDQASQTYVKGKLKTASEVGIIANLNNFSNNVTTKQIEQLINELNQNDDVDGILLQLPIPKHLDSDYLIDLIDESKDVDGFNVYNQGRLFQKRYATLPATPKGIMMLLNHYDINVQGLNACVIGRSQIVGAPIAKLLLDNNATVTIVHSKTKDLSYHTKNADILIAAIGRPKFINSSMVKDGAIVIDVGINKLDGKLVGDVDFEEVSQRVSFITPVPKGVGPMTIHALIDNLYNIAVRRGKK